MATGQVDLPPGYKPSDVVPAPQAPADLPPGYKPEDVIAAPAAEQPGPVGRFAGSAWDVLKQNYNPVALYALGKQFLQHPIDTTANTLGAIGNEMGDMREQAGKAMDSGDYVGAATKALGSVVPVFGPEAGRMYDSIQQGDVAGALGRAAGNIATLEVPKLLPKALGALQGPAGSLAEGVAQRALKPTGKTQAGKLAKVRAVLNEGTLNTGKIAESADAVGAELRQKVASQPQAKMVKTVSDAVDKLNELAKSMTPEEQATINTIRDNFQNLPEAQGGMTPLEAFDAKIKYQKGAVRAKKGAYEAGADNAAKVDAYQDLGESLGDTLVAQDPSRAPLNAQYSQKMKALDTLNSAEGRIKNSDAVSRIGFLGAVTSALMHHPEGAAALAMAEFLRSPSTRLRAAMVLSRASKIPLPVAKIKLAGYVDALGGEAAQAAERGAQSLPKAAEAPQDENTPIQDLTDAAKRRAGFDPSKRLSDYAKQ